MSLPPREQFEAWKKANWLGDPEPFAAYQEGRRAALLDAAELLDSVNNYDNPMTASDCARELRAKAEEQT